MFRLKLLLVFGAIAVQANQDNDLSMREMADALALLRNDLSTVQNENAKMAQELTSLKKQVRSLNTYISNQDVANHPNKTGDYLQENDVEERLEKLEELSKVGTLRSCNEYKAYGIKTSGEYMIDPDGPLVGLPPFSVYCRFLGEDDAITEIFHNTEDPQDVDHCHDPGCYSKDVTYTSGVQGRPIHLDQIEALISLSESCSQSFLFDCTLAPLRVEGVDYAFWRGPTGVNNVYFTGSNTSAHVCDCHFTEEGCVDEEIKQNTCNCDSNLPAPLQDTGEINNMDDLPILSVYFGGLTYEIQQGAYTLGRLQCKGEKLYEVATSCQALKIGGETQSGYYNIRSSGDLHTSTVFCDFSVGGYDDVPEVPVLSSASPLGTITAWVPRTNTSSDMTELPAGWLPCDGRVIDHGPWVGGTTPDLNNNGYFLRGSSQDKTLEMEDDQILDHLHDDPGHTHANDPHSHDYEDSYLNSGSYEQGGNTYGQFTQTRTSYEATISISSASTNLGGISAGYRAGDETRPRNMKVMWIIRVW